MRSQRARQARTTAAEETAAAPAPLPLGAARAPASPDRLARVTRLAGRQDQAAVNELIELYGAWSSDPAAVDARKLIVQSLLEHPDREVGLGALLTAVDKDQTPRKQDPLWASLVSGVASQWTPATLARGRDMAMLESRVKPRDLLIESLTEVRPETLTAEQRAQLVSDLIDLYPKLKPEQKPAVDRQLTALGGSDLVEILAGRGLGDESHLRSAVEEKRAQEEARRTLRVP